MQSLIKSFIKYIPVITRVFLLLFVQLLFIGTNIVGIILYARLYTHREIYRTIIAASLTSLLYDSVKMIPLGSWSLAFFCVAIPSMFILQILRMQGKTELEAWPTTFLLILLTVISAILQSYILMRISGTTHFDFISVYSIVALTILYLVIQKLTHKKERRLLLD